MDIPSLDISYKCNYLKCGLLWLASFNYNNVFKIHVVACIRTLFHFNSMYQNFVPFYCHIVSCMDILHFTNSFVSWLIDCFHFLVLMNNAAENIYVRISVWMSFFFLILVHIIRSQITVSWSVCVYLPGTTRLFPKFLHFTFLLAMYGTVHFLHILTNIC
jgi:hypothetical protein